MVTVDPIWIFETLKAINPVRSLDPIGRSPIAGEVEVAVSITAPEGAAIETSPVEVPLEPISANALNTNVAVPPVESVVTPS
jgi:hypothetical protein